MKKPFSSDDRRMRYVESKKTAKKKQINISLLHIKRKAVCKGEKSNASRLIYYVVSFVLRFVRQSLM